MRFAIRLAGDDLWLLRLLSDTGQPIFTSDREEALWTEDEALVASLVEGLSKRYGSLAFVVEEFK